MLFVSERSWKHHFVTLLLPYTYLVWELYSPSRKPAPRLLIGGGARLSCLLMATTSTEFGGLFAEGRGHEIAQGYGMFLWAAVVLYVAVAWRLQAATRRSSVAPPRSLGLAVGSSCLPRGKKGRNDSSQVEGWLILHVVKDGRSQDHARASSRMPRGQVADPHLHF